MRILVVEPQKPCRVQEIENLTDMQQLSAEIMMMLGKNI